MYNGFILSVSLLIIFFFLGLLLTSFTSVIIMPISFTPWKVLKEVIEIIKLRADDNVIELGSGDGRVLFKLLKKEKIMCKGVEISPLLLLLTRIKKVFTPRSYGRLNLEVESFFDIDLSEYDVIYLNLSDKALSILEKKFKDELGKGTFVYSYRYKFSKKKPLKSHKLSNEKILYEYKY